MENVVGSCVLDFECVGEGGVELVDVVLGVVRVE